MDRFREMQVFVRIAERKSFTLAAEDLLLPRSTVTNLIKSLEARVNTRLFERTTRQVNLTHDGELFYLRCSELLTDLDEIENLFSPASPSGLLRVNLQGTLAKHFVMPFLNKFLTQYPNITMHVAEDDRQVNLVAEGVDCVLRAGELTDSSLIAKRLATMQQVTVASPDYIAKYGSPTKIGDLKRHKAIGYSLEAKSRPTSLDFMSGKKLISVDLATSIIVAGADMYTCASIAGLGLIQVPRYRIAKELTAGTLVELLCNYPPPNMPVSALYPQNKHLPLRTRVFVDWLALQFQAHTNYL
ncbi:LysR family transcriptional regulator [Aliiglaciecola aliphaticivorans]